MASPLQVVALISGGKDSIFSLMHLQSQGHTIVALANLTPPRSPTTLPQSSPSSSSSSSTIPEQSASSVISPSEVPDLNSYMYQTAGSALIPHIATLLSLPLYQAPITGSAKSTSKEYMLPSVSTTAHLRSNPRSSTTANNHTNEAPPPPPPSEEPTDETESLIPLLRKILLSHPTANALSSGAILSTYQRTRIESVALRLGLIPLAPLWQYPYLPSPYSSSPLLKPASLLLDMATAGLEARIVKVASGGLDESVLWGDVVGDGRVREKVRRAVGRFGGSVLGEGGEFETLVMGMSGRGKIVLGEEGTEWGVGEGEGGEAWIWVKEGAGKILEDQMDGTDEKRNVRQIGLWDDGWEKLALTSESEVGAAQTLHNSHLGKYTEQSLRHQPQRSSIKEEAVPPVHVALRGSTITVSNLTCPRSASNAVSSIEHQTQDIINTILSHLKSHSLRPSAIIFTTILLRSMSSFAGMNAIYSTLFDEPLPPARVTVACGDALPPGTDIMVSVVIHDYHEEAKRRRITESDARSRKRGLHVQSRSYWAPANIGPYSQAITVPLLNFTRRILSVPSKDGEDEIDEDVSSSQEAELVYIAGQIPLVPASMEVLDHQALLTYNQRNNTAATQSAHAQPTPSDPRKAFRARAVLALQHLWRIGREMGVWWWIGGGIAFITADSDGKDGKMESIKKKAGSVRNAWEAAHQLESDRYHSSTENHESENEDDEDGPDLWDRIYGVEATFVSTDDDEDVSRRRLPDMDRVRSEPPSRALVKGGEVPPFFAVEVSELPRGCDIEWQSLGLAGKTKVTVSVWHSGALVGTRYTMDGIEGMITSIGVPLAGDHVGELERIMRDLRGGDELEYRNLEERGHLTVYLSRKADMAIFDAQVIPCLSIWNSEGEELAAAVISIST
ncbi:hypothetical protein MMC25_002530 [Agyrium rufum]|nr:hypothetical protein [Agyrium rufum]